MKRLLACLLCILVVAAFSSCNILSQSGGSRENSLLSSYESDAESVKESIDANANIPDEDDLIIQSVNCPGGQFYLTYAYAIESVEPAGIIEDEYYYCSGAPLSIYETESSYSVNEVGLKFRVKLKKTPEYKFETHIEETNSSTTVSGYTYSLRGWTKTESLSNLSKYKQIVKVKNSDTTIIKYWNGIGEEIISPSINTPEFKSFYGFYDYANDWWEHIFKKTTQTVQITVSKIDEFRWQISDVKVLGNDEMTAKIQKRLVDLAKEWRQEGYGELLAGTNPNLSAKNAVFEGVVADDGDGDSDCGYTLTRVILLN